ncbi:hypothetical protein [Planctomicrobium sp. SH527]|uniref:hypothetical protein n=1 Tax=Planctomicrobium sp. SH527 TaxID=3448123 RepID=UPI003F5C814C
MRKNVVSPFCNCTCDDLTIEVSKGQLILHGPACAATVSALHQINTPPVETASLRQSPCLLDEAILQATTILKESRSPLLFGMSGMGTKSHRAAIRLAEVIRGTIDGGGSKLKQASLLAFQQVGLSTCTLGEIRQRADLIIIWGADPISSHPRLLERLGISAHSQNVFVIDGSPTQTSSAFPQFLHFPTNRNLDLTQFLRATLRQNSTDAPFPANFPGDLNADLLNRLIESIRNCKYGVILLGEGLAQGSTPAPTVTALYQLVEELCRSKRFTARPLTSPGIENVLAWQTGFASAVNFRNSTPQSSPLEFSANELLQRHDVDCAVILGSRTLSSLSKPAKMWLTQIPTIFIDPHGTGCPPDDNWLIPTVHIKTAVDGIHTHDTIYRLDDVALPMRPLISTSLPTVAFVLEKLTSNLASY